MTTDSNRFPRTKPQAALLLLAIMLAVTCCDSKMSQPDDFEVTEPVTPVNPAPPITSPPPNPFLNERFYVKPVSDASKQAALWRASRPADAAQMDRIAAQPVAWWLGEWSGDVGAEVREMMGIYAASGTLPIFVVYNIPDRDCGGYSAGGLTPTGYGHWVRAIADAIGNRKAVILLEPDAVPDADCLRSETARNVRFAALSDAVNVFKSKAAISVYIDAGHIGWQDVPTIVGWLKRAGMDGADGFVLNISNFATNADNAAYGAQISQRLNGKHFILDTSRNGLGPGSTWCNPSGRALGRSATANTGYPLIDAYYWIKGPGESDGECNGGPPAGDWWPEYALGLAQRTTQAMLFGQ